MAAIALNVAVFALLAAIILIVAWRENDLARQQAHDRVAAELADLREGYAAAVSDYGWWDEARERIEGDRDAIWADENISQWLTRTIKLDAVYAYGADGTNLYSSKPDRSAPNDLAPLLQLTRETQRRQPLPVTGFTKIDGRHKLVAAALLRPMETEPDTKYGGVLVFAWDMDTVLERLRANARMGELAQASGSDRLELADIHGQTISLGWQPDQPGDRFAMALLPVASGVLGLLSVAGWWFWLRARQHRRALAAAEESRTRLLAAISHDLRQPLQSLSLFSTALETEVTSERARTAVNYLRIGIARMDDLLQAILNLARLDMQHPNALQLRPIDLDEVITGLVTELQPQAEAKGLSLRHVPTSLWVRSEPVLLAALLRNLISNAIRYTPHGGVLVGVRRRSHGPEVWVCDTGMGIPEDRQKLIFEEFFQVGNPARDHRLGLGLGLAIVQRLARMLNCHIRVRSTVGLGSLFAVSLAEG